jgi:para-aminobenzoate synthetase component II
VAAIQHFAGRQADFGGVPGTSGPGRGLRRRGGPGPPPDARQDFAYLPRRPGHFQGIPSPFEATRYHSLIVSRDTLPECLQVSAQTAVGEIMGLRHKEHAIFGVQFHPESILTGEGMNILNNFLKRQRG